MSKIPAGLWLVPKVPTDEMVHCAIVALRHASIGDLDPTVGEMRWALQAALIASQRAPVDHPTRSVE